MAAPSTRMVLCRTSTGAPLKCNSLRSAAHGGATWRSRHRVVRLAFLYLRMCGAASSRFGTLRSDSVFPSLEAVRRAFPLPQPLILA